MTQLLNNLEIFKKTRVFQLKNKNQFIIEFIKPSNFSVICFQSYKTLIAIYDYETKQLLINWKYWDYSKTTLKHLKLFINEYTYFKYDNKQQFLNEIRNNSLIDTF